MNNTSFTESRVWFSTWVNSHHQCPRQHQLNRGRIFNSFRVAIFFATFVSHSATCKNLLLRQWHSGRAQRSHLEAVGFELVLCVYLSFSVSIYQINVCVRASVLKQVPQGGAMQLKMFSCAAWSEPSFF